VCAAAGAEKGEVLCEKTCKALRACGRHQCLRVCCPLASVAALQLKNKGKKRNNNAGAGEEEEIGEERGGLHECDLVCGKLLGCGEHRCEERDHKGPCGGCLRSSFEEVCCVSIFSLNNS
jgi:transcriptional repressor NF-X1